MPNRIAKPLTDVLREMRTPVHGDDADIVDLLGFNGHVSGTLYDLQIAVIARGKQGRPHACPSDTARLQRPVLRAVKFMALFLGRPPQPVSCWLPASREEWFPPAPQSARFAGSRPPWTEAGPARTGQNRSAHRPLVRPQCLSGSPAPAPHPHRNPASGARVAAFEAPPTPRLCRILSRRVLWGAGVG